MTTRSIESIVNSYVFNAFAAVPAEFSTEDRTRLAISSAARSLVEEVYTDPDLAHMAATIEHCIPDGDVERYITEGAQKVFTDHRHDAIWFEGTSMGRAGMGCAHGYCCEDCEGSIPPGNGVTLGCVECVSRTFRHEFGWVL